MGKDRASNMELLRIIAMILVMIVHASVYTMNGLPRTEHVHSDVIPSLCVFFFDGLSIVCVNVFVMISGWFGIKYKLRSLVKLVFQVLFFTILIFIVLVIYNPEEYNNLNSISYIFLIPGPHLWFVKVYITLMLFSPVLNYFVEYATSKQLLSVILSFFIFQTIYGWLFMEATPWIGGGYSVTSFVGLYLLARYIRLYGLPFVNQSFLIGVMIYVGIALFHAVLAFIVTYKGIPIAGRLFTYTNPLVIIQSVALLMAFDKIEMKNKYINRIASSVFAVYLLHGHELILRGFYGPFFVQSYRNNSFAIYLIHAIGFMTAIFVVSIAIDKIRQCLWNLINRTCVVWEK